MTRIETTAPRHPALLVPRGNWFTLILQAHGLWRSRRQLAALDDAALRDLGLTREEALTEADKPLWNVPAHWLR